MFAYFVTGVTYEDKKFKDRDQRCFGYFETFEEAEKAVLNNRCDIWETIHEYVVIEKIEDGIHMKKLIDQILLKAMLVGELVNFI